MDDYGTATTLEPISTENTGSSESQPRTSRARSRKKDRSEPVNGAPESINPQSQEADSNAGERTHTPVVASGTRDLKVGDRVRILEAAEHVKHLTGKTGVVCRVRATIVNVETDSGEKQYFYREWLERLETPEEPETEEVAIDAPELKVGDRVRILEAPRNVGKLATITESGPEVCYGKDFLVLPDGDRMVMSIFASGVEFVERPETAPSKEAAPTHELEEEVIPSLELKVGDRVQFAEFCFGESRVATGEIKESFYSGGSYLCTDSEVKLPPIEEIAEQYHDAYPADGIYRSTVIVNQWFLKHCTVIAPATPESILTKYGFIDSSDLSDPRDIGEVYRDWGIALAMPNGGIIALDIFKGDQSWGKPTEDEFDYSDQDGIVNHAKSVIDEIEAAIAANQPPQMTIPGLDEESQEEEPREIFEVSQDDLENFQKLTSCLALAKNKIKGVISWDGREWVATGSSSKGLKTLEVCVRQVVERSQWTGPIYTYETLPRAKNGGFANSYVGQLVKYQKRELVLTDIAAEFVLEQAIASTPQPDALDELITDLKDELETTASTPAVVMMAEQEARDCVDSIKGHLENTRKLLLDLHEREGWKALGYNSWRECVMAEFGESKSQLYRELEAAKIERNISPIGEIGSIKESHLRPLAKLEPEQQREVWEEAVETAPNGKVTAAHVQEVAEKRLPPVQEEIPSLEELFKLYGQIAERVEHRPTHKYRNQFAVERTAHPAFSFYPLGRREAWQAWQRKYRKFLEMCPLPPEKQMLHPGYPLSEPKPIVEDFPVQQSCKSCQHRHLTGDGSEFTCGTKGDKWLCAATRDWADENGGCDKFKPFGPQVVTAQPPAGDKAEEAEAIATPAKTEEPPLKVLFNSQFGAIAGTVTYVRVAYDRNGRTLYADVPLSDVLEWM
ncbi:hypothetical protein NDA01_21800 [Trichocoleus desertorum AS-A10]|uniref:hypothetical protein n=1 Tax=Trichocoleus desertorum TaxID=1481672 RepID=UPI00329711A7